MPFTIPRLRLFGIPVKIHYSWIPACIAITCFISQGYYMLLPGNTMTTSWTKGVFTCLALFASVIIHELAHSIAAMKQGIPIASITLHIFGGIADIQKEPETPWNEIKMAIAGPLASGALALLFFALNTILIAVHRDSPLHNMPIGFTTYMVASNIMIAAFNLIPALPLDGGRMLRALIWKITKDHLRATRLAAGLTQVIAAAMIGAGGFTLITECSINAAYLTAGGLILALASRINLEHIQFLHSLGRTKVRDIMIPNPVSVEASTHVSGLVGDYFLKYFYGGFPVVEEGKAVGIVTIGSLGKIPEEKRPETTTGEIAATLENNVTIPESEDASTALTQMLKNQTSRLLVTDEDGKLTGLITKNSLLNYIEVKLQVKPGKSLMLRELKRRQ